MFFEIIQNSLSDHEKSVVSGNEKPVAVVLVMAAKRERAVRNHLDQLIKFVFIFNI